MDQAKDNEKGEHRMDVLGAFTQSLFLLREQELKRPSSSRSSSRRSVHGTRLSSLASGEPRLWPLAPSPALGSSTCGAVRAVESRRAQQLSLCRTQLAAQHG